MIMSLQSWLLCQCKADCATAKLIIMSSRGWLLCRCKADYYVTTKLLRHSKDTQGFAASKVTFSLQSYKMLAAAAVHSGQQQQQQKLRLQVSNRRSGRQGEAPHWTSSSNSSRVAIACRRADKRAGGEATTLWPQDAHDVVQLWHDVQYPTRCT